MATFFSFLISCLAEQAFSSLIFFGSSELLSRGRERFIFVQHNEYVLTE